MKHPDSGSWSNYVRDLVGPGTAARMEQHLEQGCTRCKERVRALEALRKVAETDRRVEPPGFAVTSVKRLLRMRELAGSADTPRVRLILNFDSFCEPSFAGARSGAAGGRHLVYESAEHKLDLDLRASQDGAALEVQGQIFDNDSRPVAEIPAFLSEGGRICSYAASGGMGDFHLVGSSEGAMRLGLVLESERLIDLELPAPLAGDSSPGAH